jgi:undecaprenyl diphosphate synthase
MFFKKKIEIKTPRHVAFICDGNRRWARSRGMPATSGHAAGAGIVDKASEFFIKRGVSTISYFLFSSENWTRDPGEVKFLMDMLARESQKHADRAHERNIRVKFIGRRDRFVPKTAKMLGDIEAKTAGNSAGTIVIALDYGGRDEIVRAANAAIAAGTPANAEDFERFMDSGGLPPIDLMVRTSGEQRISNFMLWKLAYAELMFYPKHWPALRERDFEKMLNEYSERKRRFGK